MKHKYLSGFTLVELILVIVVVGVIAGLVISRVVGSEKRSSETALRAGLSTALGEVKLKASGGGSLVLPQKFADDPNVAYTLHATGTEPYCIDAVHKKYPDMKWHIVAGSKETSAGVCAGTGTPTPSPTPSGLAAPGNFRTRASGASIFINWDAATNATSYVLEGRQDSGAWNVLTTTANRWYTHSTLSQGVSYEYRIQSKDASGDASSWSSVLAETLVPIPGTISVCEWSVYEKQLSWTAPPNTQVSHYILWDSETQVPNTRTTTGQLYHRIDSTQLYQGEEVYLTAVTASGDESFGSEPVDVSIRYYDCF